MSKRGHPRDSGDGRKRLKTTHAPNEDDSSSVASSPAHSSNYESDKSSVKSPDSQQSVSSDTSVVTADSSGRVLGQIKDGNDHILGDVVLSETTPRKKGLVACPDSDLFEQSLICIDRFNKTSVVNERQHVIFKPRPPHPKIHLDYQKSYKSQDKEFAILAVQQNDPKSAMFASAHIETNIEFGSAYIQQALRESLKKTKKGDPKQGDPKQRVPKKGDPKKEDPPKKGSVSRLTLTPVHVAEHAYDKNTLKGVKRRLETDYAKDNTKRAK